MNDLMEQIFELLPISLRENKVVDQTLDNLEDFLVKNITWIGYIVVLPELYDKLTAKLPEWKDKIEINSDNTTNILNFFAQAGPEVFFSLKDYGLAQKLQIHMFYENGLHKKVLIENVINGCSISIITTKEENSIITDYEHELHYYDNFGNCLDNPDNEIEKDKLFSEEFLVPLEKAREYRMNFKKYQKEINQYRFENSNREIEENLVDNLFHSPFYLEELEPFVRTELLNEIRQIEGTSYEDFCGDTGALKDIISSLKNLMGESDEVVISDHFCNILESYLLGLYDQRLYNKGLIIKKLNGDYTLYYIHLDNNQIFGIPKQLTERDIKLILESNEQNLNVEGLQEFFGFGNTLK